MQDTSETGTQGGSESHLHVSCWARDAASPTQPGPCLARLRTRPDLGSLTSNGRTQLGANGHGLPAHLSQHGQHSEGAKEGRKEGRRRQPLHKFASVLLLRALRGAIGSTQHARPRRLSKTQAMLVHGTIPQANGHGTNAAVVAAMAEVWRATMVGCRCGLRLQQARQQDEPLGRRLLGFAAHSLVPTTQQAA